MKYLLELDEEQAYILKVALIDLELRMKKNEFSNFMYVTLSEIASLLRKVSEAAL